MQFIQCKHRVRLFAMLHYATKRFRSFSFYFICGNKVREINVIQLIIKRFGKLYVLRLIVLTG